MCLCVRTHTLFVQLIVHLSLMSLHWKIYNLPWITVTEWAFLKKPCSCYKCVFPHLLLFLQSKRTNYQHTFGGLRPHWAVLEMTRSWVVCVMPGDEAELWLVCLYQEVRLLYGCSRVYSAVIQAWLESHAFKSGRILLTHVKCAVSLWHTNSCFPIGQHQRGRGGALPGGEHSGERQRAAVRGEQWRAHQTGSGDCGCREQAGLLLTLGPLTFIAPRPTLIWRLPSPPPQFSEE